MNTLVPIALMEEATWITLREQKCEQVQQVLSFCPRKAPKVQCLCLSTAPTKPREEGCGPRKAHGDDKGRAGQTNHLRGLSAGKSQVRVQGSAQGNLPALPLPLPGLEASGKVEKQ